MLQFEFPRIFHLPVRHVKNRNHCSLCAGYFFMCGILSCWQSSEEFLQVMKLQGEKIWPAPKLFTADKSTPCFNSLDYWTQLFCMLPLHPQHKAHPNGLYKAKNYISWSYIPVSIWGDLKTNSLCEWVIQHGHNIIENIDNWKNGIKIIKITSLIDKPLAVKISFSFSASIFLALCTFSSSASAILCSLSFSLAAFLSL